MRVGAAALFVATLLLYIVLPATWTVITTSLSSKHSAQIFADYLLTYAFLLVIIMLASRGTSKLKYFATIPISCYYFFTLLCLSYWWITGSRFNLFFALDGIPILLETLLKTFGNQIFLYFPLLVISLVVFYIIPPLALYQYWRTAKPKIFAGWRIIPPLLLLGLGLRITHTQSGFFWNEMQRAISILYQRDIIQPIFPKPLAFSMRNEEPIFVLQLESANPMALLDEYTVDGETYRGPYMPELLKVAKDGVIIPHYWANSIQSHRSLVNILCQANNDIGQAISYNPKSIDTDCLPELLRRAGYTNLAYWAFDNPHFTNISNLFSTIGFDALYHSDIMPKESSIYPWGVDDCEFYPDAFSHLRENYGSDKKLFTFFKVSSHHYPFSGIEKYSFVNAFANPKNFLEMFVNSFLQQDYCVSKFYEHYQRFTGGNGHLFIFADQGWPLGMHGTLLNEQGAYNENFLVSMIYIPPKNRRSEFAIGANISQRFALTDITPTVLELLSGDTYQNSYASALQGLPLSDLYEDCQVLIQPYGGGRIAIVRGDDKHVYHLDSKEMIYFNLKDDWEERNGVLIETDISYPDVFEKYYCERYKNL